MHILSYLYLMVSLPPSLSHSVCVCVSPCLSYLSHAIWFAIYKIWHFFHTVDYVCILIVHSVENSVIIKNRYLD